MLYYIYCPAQQKDASRKRDLQILSLNILRYLPTFYRKTCQKLYTAFLCTICREINSLELLKWGDRNWKKKRKWIAVHHDSCKQTAFTPHPICFPHYLQRLIHSLPFREPIHFDVFQYKLIFRSAVWQVHFVQFVRTQRRNSVPRIFIAGSAQIIIAAVPDTSTYSFSRSWWTGANVIG